MKRFFYVEPQHEPNGEGNGWDKCLAKDATGFAVIMQDEDGEEHCVDQYDTSEDAAKTAYENQKAWKD